MGQNLILSFHLQQQVINRTKWQQYRLYICILISVVPLQAWKIIHVSFRHICSIKVNAQVMEKQPRELSPAPVCIISVLELFQQWSPALINKNIKTSAELPSCWLCVSLVSPPEKVSMLSALIAPFKYMSPGTSTEDEDSLSKLLPLFLSVSTNVPGDRSNVELKYVLPVGFIGNELFDYEIFDF